MNTIGTEAFHDQAMGLDKQPLPQAALLLAEGQIAAAAAVRDVASDIAKAAATLERTIRDGGIIHYVAAGSSGLMAAADALELGGTFSIPASQLRIHMAGGLPTGVDMPGGPEDDAADLEQALSDLSSKDTMIAVSASGSTPYTLAAAGIARRQGVAVVAIANNPGAPLLDGADHPIAIVTPPEVLAGSTRMGAGTAQKIALNMLSTLMAIELGHVYDGMMVNVRADNIKLRARAHAIIGRVTGAADNVASAALDATGGEVKPAILMAANGISVSRAKTILRETEGHLRAALAYKT